MNQFDEWAEKGHWADWTRKPERLTLLCTLVKTHLNGMFWEYQTTSQLYDAILPGLTPKAKAYIGTGLMYARNREMLDGYFRRGPKNQGTFGRASVQWINPLKRTSFREEATDPGRVEGREGLEDML